MKSAEFSMLDLGATGRDCTVEVVEIRSDCDRAGRLAALGVLPGSRVTVSHIAPLGDPISVRLGGQEISVRPKRCSSTVT
jgi:Fe2+ transport system protein FeoA